MTGFRVVNRAPPWLLRNQKVDEPVSGLHGRWYADMFAFLEASAFPVIANIYPKRLIDTGTTKRIVFPYHPSTGARSLLVGVSLIGPGSATINVTGSTLFDPGVPALDDSAVVQGDSLTAFWSDQIAYMDPTGFSGLGEVAVVVTPATTTYGLQASGIRRVFALEVPRSMVDPVSDTSDVGINSSWCQPVGRLIDGTSSTAQGFTRIASQLAQSRGCTRHHRTLATLEDTTNAWHVSSTSYTPLIVDAEWYWRARRLYTTADANPHKLYVRYQSDQEWTLRIKTTVNGSTTNNDFTFIANAGSFTANTSNTLNLSTAHNTSGEEQQVKVEIQAKLNVSGNLYVSCVSAIENET